MLAAHPLRGQPKLLASGVSLRGHTLTCAHLATLKPIKAYREIKLKILQPGDKKTHIVTVVSPVNLEDGLYEDVELEVVHVH